MHDIGSAPGSPTGENPSTVERSKRMTATLTVSQKAALQELASKYQVSVAWLIRQAIDRFIEEATGGPKLPFDVR